MHLRSSLPSNNMGTFVKRNCGREDERGAALITAVLVSLLLLSICGTLVLTTTTSTVNTIGSTDEMQAYYAAEAGLQASLNVLRGNVPPHPSDGTKMNFKNAVAVSTSNNPASGVAQLSRWLVYNYPSVSADRVTLSPGYSTSQGMAYTITGINDPDNQAQVIYSTSGAFSLNGVSQGQSMTWGNGADQVTLTYTPAPSTDITTNGSPTLGSFSFTGISNSRPQNETIIAANTTFTLTVTQTAPLPIGSSSPVSVSLRGTLSGTIRKGGSATISLAFGSQTIEVPNVGDIFTLTSQTLTLAVSSSTTTTIQTAVTTAEPGRLIVRVRGYGPHSAIKNLQAMVRRFGINYDPPATFVLRGDDSNNASTVAIGSSSQFVYSGVDNALQGQPLPAFLVTNSPDYTTLTTLKSNNSLPVDGDPTAVIKQLTLPGQSSSLPSWLQTTTDPISGARAFVQQLKEAAMTQYSGCSGGNSASCDRYFNVRGGDAAPTDFGMSTTDGLITFVDGNASLPNTGGRGLLIVTGTLTISGSQPFEGLVLVLGDGIIDRNGAGNAVSLGAFVVASFGSTGGFLAPSFTSSGSGTSKIQLDRAKIKTALRFGGVSAVAVSEF
jgi:hypothetical protein